MFARNQMYLGKSLVMSQDRAELMLFQQFLHPTQIPVNLQVVAGRRAERSIGRKSSFHPIPNVRPMFRILRQHFVRNVRGFC
jgi:hypothetical protein